MRAAIPATFHIIGQKLDGFHKVKIQTISEEF
jgi:hypothetical protein